MTTATALPTLPAFQLLGQPVEISKVEKELQTLFLPETTDANDPNAAGIARASLINLALYNENQDNLEKDASILAELTSEAACRSLLINADRKHTELSARAWIQAHCQIGRDGHKSVCTEQISFFLTGDSPGLLRNIVFANLDSDLPLAFWWRGEFSDAFEERLYSRIDRLLFDSECWDSPRNQFIRLTEAQAGSSTSFVMHDLAFTRINSIRHAIANAFDGVGIADKVGTLGKVKLRYAEGFRMSALYLAGWVASRLKGKLDLNSSTPNQFIYHGKKTEFVIEVSPLDPERKGSVEVDFELSGAKIEISRCQTRDFIRTLIHRDGCPVAENWLPASGQSDPSLVADILTRAGRNSTHRQILPQVQELLTL